MDTTRYFFVMVHGKSSHHVAAGIIKSRRMVSSGMLHHVALARTDVSEELSASFIRVTRIGELETTLV
jgi:hypothetical protein